jgi:hypothetical protein
MIGAAMAGFLLLTYGWVPTGVFLGAAGILAGIVLHVFALERIR